MKALGFKKMATTNYSFSGTGSGVRPSHTGLEQCVMSRSPCRRARCITAGDITARCSQRMVRMALPGSLPLKERMRNIHMLSPDTCLVDVVSGRYMENLKKFQMHYVRITFVLPDVEV